MIIINVRALVDIITVDFMLCLGLIIGSLFNWNRVQQKWNSFPSMEMRAGIESRK